MDHLVYAVPDLAHGVARFSEQTGVHPSQGGPHIGLGTANHLAGLGNAEYLEIIGPDPDQPEPPGPRPFGIDELTAPRLVTWAIAVQGIEDEVALIREAGDDPGEIMELTRRRPDGELLRWKVAARFDGHGDGIVPFLIDWGDVPHPSLMATPGATLVRLRAEHPYPSAILPMLEARQCDFEVDPGDSPRLIATIACPKGKIQLS